MSGCMLEVQGGQKRPRRLRAKGDIVDTAAAAASAIEKVRFRPRTIPDSSTSAQEANAHMLAKH